MEHILVSLAGQPNTGKSSGIRHLAEKHGFEPVSPPNVIRQYADDKGIELKTREDWAQIRAELTNSVGPDWLLQDILARSAERLALDGLSTRYDYDRFRGYGNVVIALVCPIEICFQRAVKRQDQTKDSLVFEDYAQAVAKESYNSDPHKMSRQEIVDLTPHSHRIDASRSIEAVHADIDTIVEDLLLRQTRG